MRELPMRHRKALQEQKVPPTPAQQLRLIRDTVALLGLARALNGKSSSATDHCF